MKNKLIASAASQIGIEQLITRFYCGTNIHLIQNGIGIFEVHNSSGKIDGVLVVLKKGRYRFEAEGT